MRQPWNTSKVILPLHIAVSIPNDNNGYLSLYRLILVIMWDQHSRGTGPRNVDSLIIKSRYWGVLWCPADIEELMPTRSREGTMWWQMATGRSPRGRY